MDEKIAPETEPGPEPTATPTPAVNLTVEQRIAALEDFAEKQNAFNVHLSDWLENTIGPFVKRVQSVMEKFFHGEF